MNSSLTQKELRVLSHSANGLTTKEIGDQMSLSPFTIKTHLDRIMKKLGALNRTHAVAIALRSGWIR